MGPVFDAVRHGQDSLRSVSEETGGFAAVNHNDLNESFARIIRGEQQLLRARLLSRRRQAGRPVPQRRRAGEAAGSDGQGAQRLRRACRQVGPRKPKDGFDAKIPRADPRSAGEPDPGSGCAADASSRRPSSAFVRRRRSRSCVEIGGTNLPFTEKDGIFNEELEIHIIAIDAAGKVQAGARDAAPLHLRPANHEAVAAQRTSRDHATPGPRARPVSDPCRGAGGERRRDRHHPAGSGRPGFLEGRASDERDCADVRVSQPDDYGEPRPGLQGRAARAADRGRAISLSGDTLALFTEIYDNQPFDAPQRRDQDIRPRRRRAGRLHRGRLAQHRRTSGQEGGFGYTANVPLAGFARRAATCSGRGPGTGSNGASASRELEFRVR